MKNIVLSLVVGIGLALAGTVQAAEQGRPASAEGHGPGGAGETNATVKVALPRLVDLGADKCIPCKMMAPVLTDLRTSYAGRMDVEFIDVWKNPDAGKAYRIHLIPTQIFYDATGKELFRHEGFLSKKDILAKWKELGVDFGTPKGRVESPKTK